MSAFLPKKGYYHLPKKSYRLDQENSTNEEANESRKRKQTDEAGHEGNEESEVKRSRSEHEPSGIASKGYERNDIARKGYAHIPKKGYYNVPQKGYARKGYGAAAEESEEDDDGDYSDADVIDEDEAGKGSANDDSDGSDESEEDVDSEYDTDGNEDDSDSAEDSEEDSDGEISDFDDGFDENFYGDAADIQMLMQKSEIEREAILEGRRRHRMAMQEKKELLRQIKRQKKLRRSKRASSKTANKRIKHVSEVRRERRKEEEARKAKRALQENDEDYTEDDSAQLHQREDVNEDEEDRFEQEEYEPEEEPLTAEEMNRVRIPRTNFEKWWDEFYFDDAIRGAYVRYCIGMHKMTHERTYRCCKIEGVADRNKYKTVYKMPSGRTTSLRLILSVGGTSKDCKLDMISDHRFTKREIDHWMRLEKDSHVPIPTRKALRDLEDRMRRIVYEHRYTEQEVHDLVMKRKAAARRKGIRNLGSAKARLAAEELRLKQKEGSLAEMDAEERERFEAQREKFEEERLLFEQEEANRRQSNAEHADMVRKLKAKQALYEKKKKQLARERLRRQRQNLGKNTELDPFARRETNFEMYWLSKAESKKSSDKASEKEKDSKNASSSTDSSKTLSMLLEPSRLRVKDTRGQMQRQHNFVIGATKSAETEVGNGKKKVSKKKKKKKKKKGISISEWKRRSKAGEVQ
eukprot:g2186.t1